MSIMILCFLLLFRFLPQMWTSVRRATCAFKASVSIRMARFSVCARLATSSLHRQPIVKVLYSVYVCMFAHTASSISASTISSALQRSYYSIGTSSILKKTWAFFANQRIWNQTKKWNQRMIFFKELCWLKRIFLQGWWDTFLCVVLLPSNSCSSLSFRLTQMVGWIITQWGKISVLFMGRMERMQCAGAQII